MSATPVNPNFRERIAHEFATQGAMALIEARLTENEAGRVTLEMPITDRVRQQYGVIHGGMVTVLADSASGLAAIGLLPAEDGVLSIEFKTQLLAPGRGEKMIARGRVLKAGRTVVVAQADIFCVENGRETQTAMMINTLLVARGIASRVQP
jgi:uncharacterized protein (TIGR00369 family)